METIKIGELELRKVDIFAGLSYEQVLRLVLPESDYVAIVRWMDTAAGKAALDGYHSMSWAQRTKALNMIVPWLVDRNQLRKTTNRIMFRR